jgi:hypothetical protein
MGITALMGNAEAGSGGDPADPSNPGQQATTRLPFWIAEMLLVFVDGVALIPSGIIVSEPFPPCLP